MEKRPFMIIAVDGPAGAGKGTLAHHLAHIYSLECLDTGLLYRAVAFKILKAGDDLHDKEAAGKAAQFLQREDLHNPLLRSEEIGNGASIVATFSEVRAPLLEFQRNFASNTPKNKQGVILDGRDIGLVVLPEAPCKIFVTASPRVRAERRLKELHQKKNYSIFEDVLEDIEERDTRDRLRKLSPLRPAEDSFILDTSELEIDDVVEKASVFVDLIYPHAQKKTDYEW